MEKVISRTASIAASILLFCAASPLLAAAPGSYAAAASFAGETVQAEDDNVSALYRKYENNPAVTTVYISSAMFDILRNMDISGSLQVNVDGGAMDVDAEELSQMFETVSSLTGLYILSTEDQAVASDIRQNIRLDGAYVQLMKVKDGVDKVDFYYKSPDRKRIVEFLMLAYSDEETVIIQFESDSLTLDDVARLATTVAQGE